MDGSPGCSGAARPRSAALGSRRIDLSPGGAAETLAGTEIPPAFPRPSRADPISCDLTQGFAALHPGLRSAAPSGAGTGVWPTIPGFATKTSYVIP
jgi:hypothetical protein